jgi:hypothetical protein
MKKGDARGVGILTVASLSFLILGQLHGIVLKDGTQLTVGRSFRNRLRDLLENRPPG